MRFMVRVVQKGSRAAFTILELLVVIAVLGILMGMVMSFRPNTEIMETKALIMNLGLAIDQYRSNFYVYPRSSGNGYRDDAGVLQASQTDFYWILTRHDMVRRDGKYVEQLWKPDGNIRTTVGGDGATYILDGWGRRLVYYSGAELLSDPTSNDTPQCIPHWLVASGKISAYSPSLAGRYRADDFYFLGSAGGDGLFRYNVVQPGGGHDPEDYIYLGAIGQTDGPSAVEATADDDDIWNNNLGEY
jgi:prepilin-type N-terminal cleavage/methylation domain-containing protein